MAKLVKFKPRKAPFGFKIVGTWDYDQLHTDLIAYLGTDDGWWVETTYEDQEYGTEDGLNTDGKIYLRDENLALLLRLKTDV